MKSIVIPRKKESYSEGIGYVFIEFDNERMSQIAAYLLSVISKYSSFSLFKK